MRIQVITITGPGMDPGLKPPDVFAKLGAFRCDHLDCFGNRYTQAGWMIDFEDLTELMMTLRESKMNAHIGFYFGEPRLTIGPAAEIAIG